MNSRSPERIEVTGINNLGRIIASSIKLMILFVFAVITLMAIGTLFGDRDFYSKGEALGAGALTAVLSLIIGLCNETLPRKMYVDDTGIIITRATWEQFSVRWGESAVVICIRTERHDTIYIYRTGHMKKPGIIVLDPKSARQVEEKLRAMGYEVIIKEDRKSK